MTALTLRNTKGSPVTYTELDANFTALDAAKMDKSANLSDVANVVAALANLGGIPLSQKGAVSGVATLDSTGKIPMSQISGYVVSTLIGVSNGVAALDANGKIPLSYLQSYVLSSAVGAANGVATLDSSGKVPLGQIPATLSTYAYVDSAIAALSNSLNGGVAGQLVATSKVLTPQLGLADATQNIYFDAIAKEPILEVRGFKFKFVSGYLVCMNKSRQILGIATGTAETFVVPAGIYFIFVKMWGAGGGGGSYGGWRQGGSGGGGGYSHGIIPVNPGETITYRVGSPGLANPGTSKGWPDGGGASTAGGDNQYCGSGGGSTSIHVPSLGGYIMYAGAGGGGGACNGWAFTCGGAGGGLAGEKGSISNSYATTNAGGGGTQTAGGAAGTPSSSTGQAGARDQGGTHQGTSNYGGGGGGGYYGGASGLYGPGSHMGAGGGGSGYVAASVIMGLTVAGCQRMPAQMGDPDISVANGAVTPYAIGGEENGPGGSGLIAIYY
jgi:hypothetical protein